MTKANHLKELKIDFLHDHINYSRKGHRGKSELIAKALGAGKGIKKVLDLTCGLAQDAFFLAQLGFNVTALERSPALFEILHQALKSAKTEAPDREDLGRLQIVGMDAFVFLRSEEFGVMDKTEMAIYLDPMFPEKKKTALPRKEMQIFRTLVGNDADASELLALALKSACSRVVVKRPLRAEPLGPGVINQFEGTTVRYDLYNPRAGL